MMIEKTKINQLERLRKLFVRRLSTRDQMFFARRLSFLVGSGVPLLESLEVLLEQASSRALTRVLARTVEDVRNGKSLAAALGRFSGQFGEFAVNIIRVGESGGALAVNLRHLAEELEKKDALRKKVVSALVYPVFITIATLGVTGLLTVYIFPKITPIFNSLNVDLPLTTRLLIGVSTFLREHGLALIGACVVLAAALVVLHRSVRVFRVFWDRLILTLPIAGGMVQYYNMATLSRTLGLLLKSGTSIVEALYTTRDTTRNLIYFAELDRAIAHVQGGENVSAHFRKHRGLFPPMVSHLVAIGERTGNLADTFIYLSEFYESEIDTSAKNLSNALEPALMIMMGVLVGFVAVSVITPIYEITQTLSR
jgi:type II secretory pathway component PulF